MGLIFVLLFFPFQLKACPLLNKNNFARIISKYFSCYTGNSSKKRKRHIFGIYIVPLTKVLVFLDLNVYPYTLHRHQKSKNHEIVITKNMVLIGNMLQVQLFVLSFCISSIDLYNRLTQKKWETFYRL